MLISDLRRAGIVNSTKVERCLESLSDKAMGDVTESLFFLLRVLGGF